MTSLILHFTLCVLLFFITTASASILINSFNSGQLSKDMRHRHDLEKTLMGAEELENILVRPQGMAYRRPGTEFIDNQRRSIDNSIPEVLGDYPILRVADGTFQTRYTAPDLNQGAEISDVTDLQNMANDLAGKYYLSGDIDASATASWNGGLGFDPIGSSGTNTEFCGTFDGHGYTITGLTINRPAEDEVGLFGVIDARNSADVVIKDVTLADCDITGENSKIGSLVGLIETLTGNNKTYLYNCHSTGSIATGGAGGISSGIGGLIGYIGAGNDVRVYDCTTTCDIDTTATAEAFNEVGGLVGGISSAPAYFYNSRASGDVTGDSTNDNQYGGFVGYATNGTFQDCHARGSVNCEDYAGGFCAITVSATFIRCSARGNATNADAAVGGFVANTYGTNCSWTDCYAWGDATDSSEGNSAGGFCGDTNANTLFTNCYAIGIATGYEDPVWGSEGGFIGWDFGGSSTYDSCFWDTEASGLDSDGHDGGAEGHETIWFKRTTNFPGSWDFDNVWYQDYTAPVSDIVELLGKPIRLIPFEYSESDAYVLEFGDGYIGFLRTTP